MVLTMVIMYFILIKPQRRQQKEHEQMLKKVKAGDMVVTTGGIHGTIAAVNDHTFMVKIADKLQIEVNQSNVAKCSAPEVADTQEEEPSGGGKNRRKRS